MSPLRAGGEWVLPASMFLGTFAWSFVYVSLPFYIQSISTLDAIATLRWTGWILGVSPLITVVTAPLSGRLGERIDPKRGYIAVQMFQGVGFLLMALARTLPELFFARLLLGLMGAVSTFAFIIVGRSSPDVRRGVSAIQSGMTLGQVLGPAAGAVVAARLGFRLSFLLAGLMLWGCSSMVAWGVPRQGAGRPAGPAGRTASVREVGTVCLLVLAGSTQVFFLTAILPQILPPLGVPPEATLEVGGLIIFATGMAAALGSMAAPRLAEVLPERRLVAGLLGVSSLAVGALVVAHGAWGYGLLRFLQVLCLAPVFPIVVARIAHTAGGEAIGIINASRIGASFVGPVLATSLLASGSSSVLYVVLALIGAACVPLSALRTHVPAVPR
jgi:MFS family permease